ncbi:MAG: LacI family DNA-binding transcriptional regulator [Terriglobales bacterium]
MNKKVTLFDIADALGVSTGTVHRALHDHPGINAETKRKVLSIAKSLGYRPNLAARFLASGRGLKVSVNTLKGTTSFWDDVRAGIAEEANALPMENVEIICRTYPRLDEGDEEAFEAALNERADGIIVFPSRVEKVRHYIASALRLHIPTVCVATDAPNTDRLAVVSTDNLASGALAADLLGTWLRGTGKVAITLSDFGICEHADKYRAFESTLSSLYPNMRLEKPIEDHDVEPEAYEKCRQLFDSCPDLAGMYITTEASIPVIRAARDAGILEKLTIITTDLFPELVTEIRSGAVIATIYQRPRAQGRMAFRSLYEFLVEGKNPPSHFTLAPHLVMRGNLDFFLQRQSSELNVPKELSEEAEDPMLETGTR